MKCTLINGSNLIIDGASHQVISVKDLPPNFSKNSSFFFWGARILGPFITAKRIGTTEMVIFELKSPLVV